MGKFVTIDLIHQRHSDKKHKRLRKGYASYKVLITADKSSISKSGSQYVEVVYIPGKVKRMKSP